MQIALKIFDVYNIIMKFLHLDSRYRSSIFTSNNKWTYTLQQTIQNPHKISLIASVMPNTQYVINDYNNQFSVQSGGTVYTATLTKKNYTPSSFATELQTQLTALGIGGATWTVTVDTNTLKYTIASVAPIIYKFGSNQQLSRQLGFPTSDSTAVTSITSTNVYNLNTSRYFLLNMRGFQVNHDSNIATSPWRFIIPMNSNGGEYTYINETTNINNALHIGESINISQLEFELYDEFGNLCNLNNSDYLLVLKIE